MRKRPDSLRSSALLLLCVVLVSFTTRNVSAVIVFLKDQDEPIRGFLVREDENVVVIDELLADNSIEQRTLTRTNIDDLIKTVSNERLADLQPDDPDKYREYAEELAEKSRDPEARAMAIRLFLIAAHLAPDRLGRSCLLGMVPLARSDGEQRRFRAMAYLLDPAHDPALLRMPARSGTGVKKAEPPQAEFMLQALRLLRQGKKREAMAQARRSKMSDRLHLLTDTISFEEFERACKLVCPDCQRGRQTCPVCKGRKFVRGKSCANCGARGTVTCARCGGNYQQNKLAPSLLKRIIQIELAHMPADSSETPATDTASRPSWSHAVEKGKTKPLPPLSLESLTEFDPHQDVFRDGKWTAS